MSILTGPRINFWGGIRADVSVPNNSAKIPQPRQSSQNDLKVFDLTTSTIASEAASYSDDELNAMLNEPSTIKKTGKSYYTASGWNHYGKHVVDMQSANISSEGVPGKIDTSGSLVGQPVYLLGSIDPVTKQGPFSGPMMVDLDPTSSITTQIFVGGLQIGSSSSPELLIRYDTVCSSIDVTKRLLEGESDAPGSSVASGTFQLTFPISSVVSYNEKSPTLKAIMTAPDTTGIVVRFVMYEMCPTMTTPELQEDYAANRDTPNPSIGRVVGTIAAAFAGEPKTTPDGRQITNVGSGQRRDHGTGGTGYASIVSGTTLSIDMLNIIPKASFRTDRTDITSPIGPNVDYGTVSVDAGSINIATLDPTSDILKEYYVYGGIVDLPLDGTTSSAVESNCLSITAPNTVDDTTLNAVEKAYRIYSDQRNEYVYDNTTEINVTLQVRYLGKQVTSDTAIKLENGPPGAYEQSEYYDWLDFPTSLTVKANTDSVTFSVKAKTGSDVQAGFANLSYSTSESYGYFSNFRKYATTDFGLAPNSMISWDVVYENVLRFHYLAFPAMSRFFPLDQADAIINAKEGILARTSEAYRDTTLYMPVVRSMSPSQRSLLKAFLDNEPWPQVSE